MRSPAEKISLLTHSPARFNYVTGVLEILGSLGLILPGKFKNKEIIRPQTGVVGKGN